MMVIMMAITKKIALINVIEDNPNAVEMSVPPMAEPNAKYSRLKKRLRCPVDIFLKVG